MRISLFRPRIRFQPIDPLADGLGDEIAKEQRESQAINLNQSDVTDIQKFWTEVEEDIRTGNAIEFAED